MVDVLIKYNLEKYNFVKLIEDLYEHKLDDLHTILTEKFDIPDGVAGLGKDTHSNLHRKFYSKLNSGWVEIQNLYEKFIKEY